MDEIRQTLSDTSNRDRIKSDTNSQLAGRRPSFNSRQRKDHMFSQPRRRKFFLRSLQVRLSFPFSSHQQIRVDIFLNQSYNRNYRAGVPQVILPVWWDTYEFAARAEWLGIGAYGSQNSAPGAEASEFAKALTRALEDKGMKTRAKEIGNLCRKVEGREFACERLSDLARGAA